MARKAMHRDQPPDDPKDASERSREAETSEPDEGDPEGCEAEAPKSKPKKNKHKDLWRGGKLYDSQRGITCHWCRQKTVQDSQVTCTHPSCRQGQRGRTKLPNTFCGPCLRNRHGEDAAACAATGSWVCPPCRVSCGPGCSTCCNCGPCRAKAKLAATGKALHHAQKAGFTNVHDWLVHLETGESADAIAARKAQRNWGAINIPPESTTGPGAHPDASLADLSSPAVVSTSEEPEEQAAVGEQGAAVTGAAAAATAAAADEVAAGANGAGAREAGAKEKKESGRADGSEGTEAAGEAPTTGEEEAGGSKGAAGDEGTAGRDGEAPITGEEEAGGSEVAAGDGGTAGRDGVAPTTREVDAGGGEGAMGDDESPSRASSMPTAATAGKGAAAVEAGSMPGTQEHHPVRGMPHDTALATPKGDLSEQCKASSAAPGPPNAKRRKRAASRDAWDTARAEAGCEDVPSPIRQCRLADAAYDQLGGRAHKRRRDAGAEDGPSALHVKPLVAPHAPADSSALDGTSSPNGDGSQGACSPSRPAAVDLPSQEQRHGPSSDKEAHLRAALRSFQSSCARLQSRQQLHQAKVDALAREHASLAEESRGLAEDVAAIECEHAQLLALYNERSR